MGSILDQKLFFNSLLEEEGYTVLEARNFAEAIRISKQKKPIHLSLTDIVMPGMSGPELARVRLGWIHQQPTLHPL